MFQNQRISPNGANHAAFCGCQIFHHLMELVDLWVVFRGVSGQPLLLAALISRHHHQWSAMRSDITAILFGLPVRAGLRHTMLLDERLPSVWTQLQPAGKARMAGIGGNQNGWRK
jgi:hypothetical protein